MRIKKGDIVKILSGKDRGKEGKVMLTLPKKDKVVVKGVHIVTKHKKKTQDKTNPGGVLKQEAPIHVSNVMLVCTHTGKPTRTKYEIDKETGKKVRISKKANKQV